MARLARVVAPGIPHHITQRGNRRQSTFFHESDYQLYLDLALEWSQAHGMRIWSYCLMPNHYLWHKGSRSTNGDSRLRPLRATQTPIPLSRRRLASCWRR